jgi:hypothetical protein
MTMDGVLHQMVRCSFALSLFFSVGVPAYTVSFTYRLSFMDLLPYVAIRFIATYTRRSIEHEQGKMDNSETKNSAVGRS